MLVQNAEDIPFDLKHYPHIIYEKKIARLRTDLEKRIKWCIANPSESITKVDLDFEFALNGVVWQERPEVINIPFVLDDLTGTSNCHFSLQVGLHNISSAVVEHSSYHLSLVAPKTFLVQKSSESNTDTPVEQNVIIRFANLQTLFPNDWYSFKIDFVVLKKDIPTVLAPIELTLRSFSELGSKDYKFKVKLISPKKQRLTKR